jgi:hypothetical protein
MININEEIAVFNKGQGVFVGWINSLYFKWDTNEYDVPVRILLKNIFSGNPNHRNKMNNTKDRKLTKEGEFVVDFLIKSYGITNFGQKALETYKDLFKKYHPVINEEQYDENGELNDDAIPF